MHQETNQYEKLANISYDKDSQIFSYDNLAYDSQIDAMAYCRRAEEAVAACVGDIHVHTELAQIILIH